MRGVGTDIVMISRIEHWVKDAVMLEKVFTEEEKLYCLKKKHPHKHLASFFAVKEAFMKAIGTGWSNGVGWKDIEVINKEGVLSVKLSNGAKELCDGQRVFVSTSFSSALAIATVVIDGNF
ncbi:MAG: holo-ACP synthase [Nitrospirae bacterium]|nr:holo-ACP synthase [Nitrospirota bacterium]